ncbi:MAG: UV DNA damage repair endonuclease UvsE [Bacilli bacterium]|nr:UV DNA damage repair endonuclease UvsE [Bacilli bacterium]MBP3635547.1 UV DNA damage repair endonuclease UvsE [Bacilli bacterium]
MIVRLGYVAISKTLDNVTSSSTITYTNFIKNNDFRKLDNIIKSNFEDLTKILNYNIKNNIHFYRLTSKLIPLATHKGVEFEYINKYKNYYEEISKLIKESNMRVDVHPDQFCVLNSTNKDVFENTIEILKYHISVLKALKITNPIIVLHVGSSVFGKEKSITRFINNFKRLPKEIQNAIALENDDKIYNADDVLAICKKLNIPFVLDYHHEICNPCINIDNILSDILNTWKGINPKMHFSSPKNRTKKDFRSHNDFIFSDDFILFLEKIKKYNTDIDIMLEAKEKDNALFKLVRELKYKTNYKFIDETSFEVK